MRNRFTLLGAPLMALLALTPAAAQTGDVTAAPHGPTLIQPVDGAVLSRQVELRIGFRGRGPQGPADGTGLAPEEHGPPGRPFGPPSGRGDDGGPSDGTGVGAEPRSRGPHFAVLIDAPLPAPGSDFVADQHHIPFPVGIPRMTVTLESGPHQLTLLVLDRRGAISPRFRAAPPTRVTVQ